MWWVFVKKEIWFAFYIFLYIDISLFFFFFLYKFAQCVFSSFLTFFDEHYTTIRVTTKFFTFIMENFQVWKCCSYIVFDWLMLPESQFPSSSSPGAVHIPLDWSNNQTTETNGSKAKHSIQFLEIIDSEPTSQALFLNKMVSHLR